MAEQPSQPEAKGEAQETPAGGGAPRQPPEAMAEEAIQSAEHAAERIKSHALGEDAAHAAAHGRPLQLEDLAPRQTREELAAGLGLLDDIDLTVRVELGRTLMYVEDVLRLNENSVVELDKAAGDPVDIFVNDRHVARGEVLVLNENFCVRISEIIKQPEEDDEGHMDGLMNGQSGHGAAESKGVAET